MSSRAARNFGVIGCFGLAIICRSLPAAGFAPGSDDPLFDRPIAVAPSGESGVWRTKTQSVFDRAEHSLVRRLYTVWDATPSRDLDFMWTPHSLQSDKEDKISGVGTLIWRYRNVPAYDPASVFAEYKGAMKDGRAEGEGSYFDKAGFTYKGGWRNGLIDGFGRLTLPNGDEYVGQVRAGKANGTGRYVDITGEIFEGSFVDGERQGIGTTTLPNGNSYRSTWQAGNETADSRQLRLAQSGGQVVPGGANDIRIGITIDKSKAREGEKDLTYAASSDDARMLIQPDNARLMEMWKGEGDIQLLDDEEAPDEGVGYYGVLSPKKGQLIPLTLSLHVENRSAAPVSVTGAYLGVASSVSDLQPAIQLHDLSAGFGCGDDFHFNPAYRAENFGWGAAQHAVAHFSFANPNVNARPSKVDIAKTVGAIEHTAIMNFEPELNAAGVNIAQLKAKAKEGFICTSKAPSACLQQIKGTGFFGSIAPQMDLQRDQIMVSAAGTLDYSWRDGKGAEHSRSSPYNVKLALGHVKVETECGEGGAPDVVTANALQFKLDQSDYKLPISFRRSIPAGRTSQFLVSVKADKASEHEFTVVLQLADGREIASRPISLTYYLPSWYPPAGR